MPARARPAREFSVTIVMPCRNEFGNIEVAIRRMPRFASEMEIIFVEGHSSDGTYEECFGVRDAYPAWDIKVLRQSARGKGDAVRVGFTAARGDILIILDTDLTISPEALPKFYDALIHARGEFAQWHPIGLHHGNRPQCALLISWPIALSPPFSIIS